MKTTADAVVIGGGVNGASTAYYLGTMGVRDVILVERSHLAAGGTGKSGASVEAHHTHLAEAKLAYESLRVFRNWGEIIGGDCGWRQTGFAQVVAPEDEDQLRKNVADQQRLGVNTQVIAADELKDIDPEVDTEELGYAAYEPDSGYADPNATTFSLARQTELAVPGLFVIAGSSTGGFKIAPAVGRCLAEWITLGAPVTADLSPFSSSRFASGNYQDDKPR